MMTGMRRCTGMIGVLVLAVGCSPRTGTDTVPPETTATTTPTSASAPTSAAAQPSTSAPGSNATPEQVARWVAAGQPADPADFQTVERDGETTHLNDGEVAFRPPGSLAPNHLSGCIHRSTPALSCMPALESPPPRPENPLGQWIGNWVDFDGSTITVGGYHGDPGPFNDGPGQPLPYGASVTSGDYQCRSDPGGLYCVSLSHHTGLRMSDRVVAYGCVRQPEPPEGVGEQYDCD